MLNILRNNYCRMLKRLPMTLALIFVTLISLLLGVYISGQQVKGHIAVVYQKSDAENLENDLSGQQKDLDTKIQAQLTNYSQEKAAAEAKAAAQVQQTFSATINTKKQQAYSRAVSEADSKVLAGMESSAVQKTDAQLPAQVASNVKAQAEKMAKEVADAQFASRSPAVISAISAAENAAKEQVDSYFQSQAAPLSQQLADAESQAKNEVDSVFDKQISPSQIEAMRKMIRLPIFNTLSDASQKLDVIKQIKNLSAAFSNSPVRSGNDLLKVSELENYAIIQYASDSKNQKTKYLELRVASVEPPLSSLLRQKYDALIVIPSGDASYRIQTLRNNSFRITVKNLIESQSAASVHFNDTRNTGETITGFLLLFLLLSIFSTLFTLSDDKERGMLVRLNTTPMRMPSYLAAQMLYAFTTLIPSFIALAVLHAAGVNIGLTLIQYALVYLCVALFGIPLALWFISVFQNGDDATLFGNSILILSTVLSGAFFSVNNNSRIFKALIFCLPQRQILNFVDYLHNGTASSQPYPVLYILAAGFLLFGMAAVNLRFQAHKAR